MPEASLFPSVPEDISWKFPWQAVVEGAESLVEELKKEICDQHPLHGVDVKAVGRRGDCDDVLFITNDRSKPIVVVHLTWTGREETDPAWPWTTFFVSWEDWFENCLKSP